MPCSRARNVLNFFPALAIPSLIIFSQVQKRREKLVHHHRSIFPCLVFCVCFVETSKPLSFCTIFQCIRLVLHEEEEEEEESFTFSFLNIRFESICFVVKDLRRIVRAALRDRFFRCLLCPFPRSRRSTLDYSFQKK